MSKVKTLSVSFFHSLFYRIFCVRTQTSKLKKKMISSFDKHLDIRQIVRQQLDLRILLETLLTEEQQSLFKFNRKRIDPSSDDIDSDKNLRFTKKSRMKFLETMLDFKTQNRFERKLLQGVIKQEPQKHKNISWLKKPESQIEDQNMNSEINLTTNTSFRER